MYRFHSIISVIFILAAIVAEAAVLSPEQALERIRTDAKTPARLKGLKLTSNATSKLIYTQVDADRQPTVYLFGGDEGFVMASADDIGPALLGYGDHPVMSEADMNPTFKCWMEEYGRQIEWSIKNGGNASQACPKKMKVKRDNVGPLLTTKWNQGEPYNDQCPVYNGARCVTGCVATALCQVMNYHEWPKQGVGTLSYEAEAIGQTLSLNFSRLSFDWDKMLDVYTETATNEQREAIAKLMYAVGVGVKMGYSPEGSGATDDNAATALNKYFRYQDGIVCYWRSYMVNYDWEQLVYDEITQNGPLYYSGSSTTGAHAFVCDGYTDGYFHFNWGWGGMSDGYFLLDALNPDQQGIGGSSGGYNFFQIIIGRVRPDRKDEERQEILPFLAGEGLVIEQESVAFGDYATISNGIFNFTMSPLTGMMGMKATDGAGKTYYLNGYEFENLEFMTGLGGWPIYIDNIPEGTYSICPSFRYIDGRWYDVGIGSALPRTTTMVVKDRKAYFYSSSSAPVRATELQPKTEFYLGGGFALSFRLENTEDTEYAGHVTPVFVDRDNNIVLRGDNWPVYLKGKEAVTVGNYSSRWFAGDGSENMKSGSYRLCLIDAAGNVISEYLDVTIKAAESPQFYISDFRMEGDLSHIDPDNIHASAVLHCTKGYFANSIMMYIFPYIEGQTVYSVGSLGSDLTFLSAGQDARLDFSGAFPEGEPGKTYFAHLYLDGFLTQDAIVFTLGQRKNGVESITETDEKGDSIYYDLQGRRVKNPTRGIYIRVSGGKSEKVVF